MALAQAVQQAESVSTEARLATLEARMCASLQASPDSRRMTHDIALLGYEAIRAEDINSILARLVRALVHCKVQARHGMLEHRRSDLSGMLSCLMARMALTAVAATTVVLVTCACEHSAIRRLPRSFLVRGSSSNSFSQVADRGAMWMRHEAAHFQDPGPTAGMADRVI